MSLTMCPECGLQWQSPPDVCPRCHPVGVACQYNPVSVNDVAHTVQPVGVGVWVMMVLIIGIASWVIWSTVLRERSRGTSSPNAPIEQSGVPNRDTGHNVERALSVTSWVKVAGFSGYSEKNTEPFTVRAPWKVVWSTRPGNAGNGNFAVFIYDSAGNMVDLAANVVGTGSDECYQYNGGTFYLNISTSQAYAVDIYEGQ